LLQEKRKRLGKDGELDEDAEAEDGEDADGGDLGPSLVEEEEEEEPGGGLLVTLDEGWAGVAKSGAAMADRWFKQELFAGVDEDDDEEDEEEEEKAARPVKRAKQAASKRPTARGDLGGEDGDADDDDDVELDQDRKENLSLIGSAAAATKGAAGPAASGRRVGGGDGFEVVPVEAIKGKEGHDSETDSEDEFDMLDDQVRGRGRGRRRVCVVWCGSIGKEAMAAGCCTTLLPYLVYKAEVCLFRTMQIAECFTS
jgi:hypothetical protein